MKDCEQKSLHIWCKNMLILWRYFSFLVFISTKFTCISAMFTVFLKLHSWITVHFAYTTQKNIHNSVDTGACRSTRTSKPVYCKPVINLTEYTKIQYSRSQKIKNSYRKCIRHRRIWKPKTTLWKKGNVYPQPAENSCGAANSRGRGTQKLENSELTKIN